MPGLVRWTQLPRKGLLERRYRECLLIVKVQQRQFLESIELPNQGKPAAQPGDNPPAEPTSAAPKGAAPDPASVPETPKAAP